MERSSFESIEREDVTRNIETGEGPVERPKFLEFSAGIINLRTGEVELKKDVPEAAREFWEAVEKFYPRAADNSEGVV